MALVLRNEHSNADMQAMVLKSLAPIGAFLGGIQGRSQTNFRDNIYKALHQT